MNEIIVFYDNGYDFQNKPTCSIFGQARNYREVNTTLKILKVFDENGFYG